MIRQTKEVEHICFTCKRKDTCDLWNQVCNIDEDFIKEAFDYDDNIQSVCTTVSYCKDYKPLSVEVHKYIKAYKDDINDDVLDRLDGSEVYKDEWGNVMIKIKDVKRILEDPEDDTNETARCHLKELYDQMAGAGADRILIIS